MSESKKRFSYVLVALLFIVFVSMVFYSFWCGVKNYSEISVINDTCSVSRGEGSLVYHYTQLSDMDDINKSNSITDDSMAVRFAGFMSKFAEPFYVWVFINILSAIGIVIMLYRLIGISNRSFLRIILILTLMFLPAFFRGVTSVSFHILNSALLLLIFYIGYLRETSTIKWYLMMALVAIIVSNNRHFLVIVYIIPFVAHKSISKSYNTGKAASHTLALLVAAFVIHFLYLDAFSDYHALKGLVSPDLVRTKTEGLKRLFLINSVEKAGIYLPLNLMAVVSFIGLFNTEKYVWKYTLPGVALYIWSVFDLGYDTKLVSEILPVVMFSFAMTLVHMKFARNMRKAIIIVLGVIVLAGVVSDVVIANNNHSKGMYITEYCMPFASAYEYNIAEDAEIMVIQDEDKFVCHMYAAYPRKVILSPVDDELCPKLIGMYYPDYIVSKVQLNYAEYELLSKIEGLDSQISYMYRLIK